jgi:NAD(P)-dependent dehydrogenase (short-subunit alcohol dehydrogenase family)
LPSADFRLDGKIVVLTGALGLLGTEYAAALSGAGAHVVVADLDEDGCKRRATEISKQTGARALGVKVDVSSQESTRALVAAALAEFGRVDVLINNAATKSPNFMVPFESFPLDDWERVMSVNLRGVFLCTQAVAAPMLEQGGGIIINVASHYGVVGPDFRIYGDSGISTPPVYSASKAGVIGLTRYLATYWAGKNIRVNCLTPGGVYDRQPAEFVAEYSFRVPLQRMANRDELRGAMLFLASDASSYVNGHNLVVDGGWTAW